MDEGAKKTRVKFYLKDNTYYLYETFVNDNGNYLYYSKDSTKIISNIKVENVGDVLTKFLNADFSFMYVIIDEFFATDNMDLDNLFYKLFAELENQLNNIWAVLIVNKLFDYLDLSFVPNFSTKLLETFNKKLNVISSFIDENETKKFDLQYLKDITLVSDPATRFKALINFICDEHELDKLRYKCLLNGNINILNLTSSNSITNIEYEILSSLEIDVENSLIEVYSIDDLTTFLYFEMLQIQKTETIIRNCETCNKFFIPSDNRQIYCNKYCNTKNYDNKVKEDPVEKIYRNASKAQNKKKNENSHRKNIERNWKTYTSELKKQKDRCKNNEITINEFKEWINKNKDWFLKNNYKPE